MFYFNVLNSFEEIVWDEQGERGQSSNQEVAGGTLWEGETGLVSAGASTIFWAVISGMDYLCSYCCCVLNFRNQRVQESKVEAPPADTQTNLETVVEENEGTVFMST